MADRITQQQLESYLWGAATLLRGTIDAGDYKQYIFPLLFFKRLCDVFDEETQAALKESGGDKDYASYPEQHRFQVPAKAHWKEVRKTASNVGQALQGAMRAIETANQEKLHGIFGDAQWTNRDRLSDEMLRDLVEHFSSLILSVENLPEDELGNGYEFLIKKFADDSGHTAAEFYTNRTVVHLMTELLEPQPSESIYDPTCGTGGMLLSAVSHLRKKGKEWRSVGLYGQERNLMTSSIARMNCFLHGVENFRIERGDTLAEPKFHEKDKLRTFDVVLANPPYSIKAWDRAAFASDPWGRNLFGVPPQGRADYAFQQHIFKSMEPKTGRCAVLWPHGVLFRQEEGDIRQKLMTADLIECVIGLGPNLFYNSPMEACILICRMQKPKARTGKILFINAINEVTRDRSQSMLTEDHIQRIVAAYQAFKSEDGFAKVVDSQKIISQKGNLSIPMYVECNHVAGVDGKTGVVLMGEALSSWIELRGELHDSLLALTGEAPAIGSNDFTRVLTELPKWLDHSRWTRLPFGTFADSINERAEPKDAADEIYVGLDALDSGDLHIRRWGKGSDVIGTKLRFRRGDVIFGRRRAYQRKVAVAEMDGICSAHAMVVRAKQKLILPEFLPFLMMGDRFMKRAVEISVGSLSPTINWTTLKLQEFDLPPLDQQRRMSNILWSLHEMTEASLASAELAKEALIAFRSEHFIQNSSLYEAVPVRNVGHWSSGNTPSRNRAEYWGGEFPWVSPKDMKVPLISDAEEHLSVSGRNEAAVVGPGAILIVIRGMILAHTFPVAVTGGDVAFNQDMKAILPSENYLVDYLYNWFQWSSPTILGRISDSSHGTKRLAMDDLFAMSIPGTPLSEQELFVDKVTQYETAIEKLRSMAAISRIIGSAMVNLGL